MRQHNLKVTGSLQINGENVISASQLSTLSASINSKIEGLNPSQIGTGSYTASISPNGTFRVNTSTIITGSLSVTSLSGSGINYLAYSGGVITAISGTAAIKYNQEFTATLGQTTFTPSIGYITGLIDVFYNGTKLSTTDYTASNGSTIVLSQGADLAGDIVEVDIYNPVSGVSNNTLRQQTTFTASAAQTTFTVNYTPGLLDVFFNGSRLSNEEYTANNGTSIILSEAATGGEIIDIFVYSYQIGAFSGVGGSGVLNQLAYWSSQSGLTGSNSLTFDGTTLTISGSLVPAVSGAYDLGSTSKPFRHIYVGSGSIYLVNNQGQVTNTISAQSIVTTDTLNSGSIDLTKSLPTGTVSGSSQIVGILTSLNTATASFTPRITNLESKSASVDISITNINSFTASNANTSLNLLTGSLATTGSNTFRGTTIMSGSTYVTGDFVVFGSSSIQYISASSVSIGTNVVNLNTNQPAVRFAGLSVQDSGSAVGVTGSMFWDGCCNRWIYSNPSGVGYSGGVLMSGPRGSTLGNEPTLTCNYVAKSGGGDHLYDSCIIDDGNIISFNAPTGSFSGKIGIGTNCPANVLHAVSSLPRIIADTTSRYAVFNMWVNGSEKGAMYWDNTDLALKFESNQGYWFIAGGSERLRITCAGNVGIGNCNPLSPLSFANTVGNKIDFYNDGSSRYTAQINSNELRFYNTSTNDVISLYANNTVGLVNKNGQVAIAHTSPVDALDVMGAFRVRCNTPNFTSVCNSLLIDYVNTSIFGSTPMARYYSIGCTGVSAGHKFIVGQPNSAFDALTIFGDGKIGINTDNNTTNTVGSGLVLRPSSSNAGQTALVIQDYRKCNKWAINGQTFANDGTLTFYSTPNNTNDYTPVFSITQNGQIQKPCNAAFHATINANTNITTGGNTIQFNCVLYNAGGAYNGTNSIFTAPVSGLYQFNFVFLNQNTQNTTGGHSFLSTNYGVGTYYFQRYGCNAGLSSTGYGGYVPMYGSVAVYLPSGCSACVRAFWDADGAFTHNSTAWASFSGYLVG